MGLEAPQGREIFTKGIVAASLVLSVPSATYKAGTELPDLLRRVSSMPLVFLAGRGQEQTCLSLWQRESAPHTAEDLKAWIHFGSIA